MKKLRNEKTGEIGLMSATDNAPTIFVDSREYKTYNSLAELNEEWEDYTEEKTYFILVGGKISSNNIDDDIHYEERLEIGNCFGTREEAELAVKKLKALKRLKDAGIRNSTWHYEDGKLVVEMEFDFNTPILDDDLNMLFRK